MNSNIDKLLKILDENTVHYMIEEMQKQIDEDKEAIAEKDSVIAEKTVLLDKSNAELANALAEINRLKKQLQEDS